jgi:hypothetical protein
MNCHIVNFSKIVTNQFVLFFFFLWFFAKSNQFVTKLCLDGEKQFHLLRSKFVEIFEIENKAVLSRVDGKTKILLDALAISTTQRDQFFF